MDTRLEHVNLQVRDIDAMLHFLRTAFPDWRIRHDEADEDGERWVHVGNDRCYLALGMAVREPAERWVPYSGKPGVNHLGFEVADVEAVRSRLLAQGYRETTVPNAHPHRRRAYFADGEGNDWEFVQYFSDVPAERNDYDHDELALTSDGVG